MAEKIRPPHLPPTSASSQQPLLVPPAPAETSQAVMSLPKLQQVPGLHPQSVPQPDVALHARPATSTVTGRLSGRGSAEWAGLSRFVEKCWGRIWFRWDLVRVGPDQMRTGWAGSGVVGEAWQRG